MYNRRSQTHLPHTIWFTLAPEIAVTFQKACTGLLECGSEFSWQNHWIVGQVFSIAFQTKKMSSKGGDPRREHLEKSFKITNPGKEDDIDYFSLLALTFGIMVMINHRQLAK